MPNQDVYQVRIYDGRRNRELVVAIELVSPSNKDRPENREAFVGKSAELLKNGICVSIVDVVGTLNFNLYAELMDAVRGVDPALGNQPQPMYAVTLRTRYKRVLAILCQGNQLREIVCWQETDLATLVETGKVTGLAEYVAEVRARLVPLFVGP